MYQRRSRTQRRRQRELETLLQPQDLTPTVMAIAAAIADFLTGVQAQGESESEALTGCRAAILGKLPRHIPESYVVLFWDAAVAMVEAPASIGAPYTCRSGQVPAARR